MSNNFETIIGLEVHVELNTNSKVFSPSRAAFGGEPNEFTNEYDWAYPGTLPRLNEGAIAGAMKASLALNMDINQVTYWDRKNYYYPDLPSGYQMTQDLYPIGHDGYLDVDVDGETRRIRIERLHLEQDAGKNIHGDDGKSYVDLNRAGTSLCEIVTYPDIRSPQEAYNFLVQLQETILYTGVSDVKMEEGSLRCDANISIRPIGQEEFNPKTEIKNLNSFNFIKKALEYEEKRQAKNLVAGKENSQQTRRYDSEANKTIVMREKSAASGYRQIPDPDVPILEIEDAWVDSLRQSLPEMPVDRRKRYVGDYGVSEDNALVLTATKEMSDFYEATIAEGADPEQAANWIVGDLSAYLNKEEVEISDTELTPEGLKDMINLIADGTISSKMAKKLFQELVENGGDANEIVEAKGWKQISSEEDLLPFINEAIEENPQSVSDYQAGKGKAMGYLVGQIMQKTRGQANPQMVNQLLKQELDKL